jgi:hypothetical protein
MHLELAERGRADVRGGVEEVVGADLLPGDEFSWSQHANVLVIAHPDAEERLRQARAAARLAERTTVLCRMPVGGYGCDAALQDAAQAYASSKHSLLASLPLRYAGDLAKAQVALQRGEFGEEAFLDHRITPGRLPFEWLGEAPSGGYFFAEPSLDLLDLACWLRGSPPASVRAEGGLESPAAAVDLFWGSANPVATRVSLGPPAELGAGPLITIGGSEPSAIARTIDPPADLPAAAFEAQFRAAVRNARGLGGGDAGFPQAQAVADVAAAAFTAARFGGRVNLPKRRVIHTERGARTINDLRPL